MNAFICTTCGTQFAPSSGPPEHCPICTDERQYVPPEGQQWTTLGAMQADGYRNELDEPEPNLAGIRTQPEFAIGQRAMLIQTRDGNLLWDCVSYIDEPTIRRLGELGGVDAIAISHPHFYSSMNEWSEAFGHVPVYLNQADRDWVMYPGANLRFWQEEQKLFGWLKLLRTGGHFPGSSVCYWPGGAEGRGVLLTADSPQVSADRKSVSVMRSYPNLIPAAPSQVERVLETLRPLTFDRVYGMFRRLVIPSDGKQAVVESLERYLRQVSE